MKLFIMPSPEMYYGDYIELDKILDAQHPASSEGQVPAHDEMLFIIVHQAYELWFKQILHELDFAVSTMRRPSINDNSIELQLVVHRMGRVATILRVLVQQIDIIETMTPIDFLEFRDVLRPASGFQSWQFKMLEAKLGLKFEKRFGKDFYVSRLRPQHIDLIHQAEADSSLLQLVNNWLERMPFFNEPENWVDFNQTIESNSFHVFWTDYRERYKEGLAEVEQGNLQRFNKVLMDDSVDDNRGLSSAACRSALFIMLYRGYPILQLPFQLLNNLLEIDDQLSTWRYRHMNMVHRVIGTRIGTGGSTGREYLQSALEKHYIFIELAQLTSFLIERRRLPVLSPAMEKRLGFAGF